MTQTINTHKPIDKYIPWMFVAFFIVVAIVNGIFVTVAIKTRPGIVTEQAYEKGLAYNETLAAAEKQKQLGWTGTTTYEGSTLRFTLKDRAGKPIKDADVKASIKRPLTDGYDREIALIPAGGGVYQVKANLPLPGLWDVRIFAVWKDTSFQTNTSLMRP